MGFRALERSETHPERNRGTQRASDAAAESEELVSEVLRGARVDGAHHDRWGIAEADRDECQLAIPDDLDVTDPFEPDGADPRRDLVAPPGLVQIGRASCRERV